MSVTVIMTYIIFRLILVTLLLEAGCILYVIL